MQTRLSKIKWVALGVGLVLVSGPAAPTFGDSWWKFKSKNSADCPADVQECPAPRHRCRLCHGRGCHACSRCYIPTNASYCDYRDTLVYSAEGYNVPVTVPLAPVARVYNYGWGIPSSRFSRAGSYAAWTPDRPFSQNGGRLPGGIYPTVYQPTDTTQLGIYYNYVPTWIPR